MARFQVVGGNTGYIIHDTLKDVEVLVIKDCGDAIDTCAEMNIQDERSREE